MSQLKCGIFNKIPNLLVTRDFRRRKFNGELPDGTLVSTLWYRKLSPDTVEFYHTETVPAHRGQGHAATVVDEALKWANHAGLQVVPSCTYVAHRMKNSAQY